MEEDLGVLKVYVMAECEVGGGGDKLVCKHAVRPQPLFQFGHWPVAPPNEQ